MANLFDPLSIRGVTLRNRIVVSPMCEYSSHDGFANDWHPCTSGAERLGGAGLIFTETAVTPEGRISPEDLGIWSDAHIEFLARIVRFLKSHGTVPGMQLAHAGRKGSTHRPWGGEGAILPEDGGWVPVAPSALAYSETYAMPRALSKDEIQGVVDAFTQGARRALEAGFKVIEIHAAHGYLIHEFFSPLSNQRTDEYGGSFENRTRLAREIVVAMRKLMPEKLPLFIRISATDWVEGGWDRPWNWRSSSRRSGSIWWTVVRRARSTTGRGAGLSGSIPPSAFARGVAMTSTVGLIETKEQVAEIAANNKADLVFMAREFRATRIGRFMPRELKQSASWPVQYRTRGTSRFAPSGNPGWRNTGTDHLTMRKTLTRCWISPRAVSGRPRRGTLTVSQP